MALESLSGEALSGLSGSKQSYDDNLFAYFADSSIQELFDLHRVQEKARPFIRDYISSFLGSSELASFERAIAETKIEQGAWAEPAKMKFDQALRRLP